MPKKVENNKQRKKEGAVELNNIYISTNLIRIVVVFIKKILK